MIAVTVGNGLMWWIRGRSARQRNPHLADGYRRLIAGWIIGGSIPWLILGAAVLTDEVHSIIEVIDIIHAGPLTIAFYVSVVFLGLALNYYIFLCNGARELADHPGAFRFNLLPIAWKLFGIMVEVAHLGFFLGAYFISENLRMS
jgi:hypothetical protein